MQQGVKKILLSVRATPDQHLRISEMARMAGRSRSNYLIKLSEDDWFRINGNRPPDEPEAKEGA